MQVYGNNITWNFPHLNAGSWYLQLKGSERQTNSTGYWKGVNTSVSYICKLFSYSKCFSHQFYSLYLLGFCAVSMRLYAYLQSVLLLYSNIIFWLQITTIAAAVYLRMAGRSPVLPSNQLSYTENFLYMLDSLYVLWYFYVWLIVWNNKPNFF